MFLGVYEALLLEQELPTISLCTSSDSMPWFVPMHKQQRLCGPSLLCAQNDRLRLRPLLQAP